MVPTGRTSSINSSGISGTRMTTIIQKVWVSNPVGCNNSSNNNNSSSSNNPCNRGKQFKTTIPAAWVSILSTTPCINNNCSSSNRCRCSLNYSNNNICCSNPRIGIMSWRLSPFSRVLDHHNRHFLGHRHVVIRFGQSQHVSLIVAAV